MFRARAFGHLAANGGAGGAGAGERDLGETEIEDFGVAALGDKKIGRLDVAMNDSFGVRGVERVGNFNGEGEQIAGLNRRSIDTVFQRHAIKKLHRNERLSTLVAGISDIVDRADVGMIEGRCGLGFALKPCERLRIASDILREELQRHKTVKARVLRLIDDTHASATKFFDDAVMGEGLADRSGGI